MSEVCNPQRVFNIYCDLADGTLPPDLWNESAELAAMVYVAVHYPAQAALSRLLAAVSNFNRVNRSLGLPQLSFDAEQVERKLTAVSRYVSSLPDSMHVGAIYRTLLMTARVEHLPSAGKSAAVPAAGLDA